MRFFPARHKPATAADGTVEPGTCMYGDHPIQMGEPYVSVTYSRERYDGTTVDVDDCGALLFACLRHAPAEEAVAYALQCAGMPL